jgi:hypothetical protein
MNLFALTMMFRKRDVSDADKKKHFLLKHSAMSDTVSSMRETQLWNATRSSMF